MKNQYNDLTALANNRSNHDISWLIFSNACMEWKVIDKNLTSQDIDRLFVAVNFDSDGLDNNEANSLCRYEFIEIIVRMGREKYFNKGLCETIAESTQIILEEFIIKNP